MTAGAGDGGKIKQIHESMSSSSISFEVAGDKASCDTMGNAILITSSASSADRHDEAL